MLRLLICPLAMASSEKTSRRGSRTNIRLRRGTADFLLIVNDESLIDGLDLTLLEGCPVDDDDIHIQESGQQFSLLLDCVEMESQPSGAWVDQVFKLEALQLYEANGKPHNFPANMQPALTLESFDKRYQRIASQPMADSHVLVPRVTLDEGFKKLNAQCPTLKNTLRPLHDLDKALIEERLRRFTPGTQEFWRSLVQP
jgi:hypothetical protein